MKEFLKKVPTPICGAMLGVLGLGNLIADYSTSMHDLCCIIGLVLLAIILLKLFFHPKVIINELKTPTIASVSGTFAMSLIILSSYIAPSSRSIGCCLWIFSVLLFIALIIYFTKEFIIKLNLENVYACYYIVYIGIVIASVTAPLFNQNIIGEIIVCFGALSFAFLLPLTMYRYLKLDTPDGFKPFICINAAPFSLILIGYLNSFPQVSLEFVAFMFVAATIFWLFSIAKVIEYRKLQFYPSYSAFGFPFVVAALCTKATTKYFASTGVSLPVLNVLMWIEIAVATILVAYVLYSYIKFLIMPQNT